MKINKFLTVILTLSLLLSSAGIYIAGADTVTSYFWNDDFSGETVNTAYKYGYPTSGSVFDGETLKPEYSLTEDDTLKITSSATGFIYTTADVVSVTGKPKLVVSVSVKLDSKDDLFGTRAGGYGTDFATLTGGKIYNIQNGTQIGTYNPGEWVDITCVYDNAASTRDIYINGVYADKYDVTAGGNYNYYGKSRMYLCLAYHATAANHRVEIDNLQMYALPEGLSYELAGANEKGVALEFNITPDKATLVPANFTVKDESGAAVTVTGVSVDSRNSRRVNVEFDYVPNSKYTVSASGLTFGAEADDVTGDAISLTGSPELSFTSGSIEIPDNTYFWYDDFSGETVKTDYKYGYPVTGNVFDGETLKPEYSLTEDDTLRIAPAVKSFNYTIADYTASSKPKMVVSLNVKNDANGDIFGNRSGGYGTDFVSFIGGKILTLQGGAEIGTYKGGEWVNVTCVYDNASDFRDIYINGVHAGKHEVTSWKYSASGRLYLCFAAYVYAERGIEIDNLQIYALPKGLKYDIASADTKGVNLEFNITPDAATVIPENFTVLDKNGEEVKIASAELVKGKPSEVKLTFETDLAAYSDYTVSAKNITTGSEENDVIGSALVLGNNNPVKFSTAGAAAIEYANDGTVFYNDYSSAVASASAEVGQLEEYADFQAVAAAGAKGSVITDTVGNANFYSRGIYKVGKEDGNKFISMTQNSTSDTYWTTRVRAADVPDSESIAFEYRVRPHLEIEGQRPIFESRNFGGYGIPMPILFDGKITFGGYEAENVIGKYHEGEWITLTTVYHKGYITVEGDANTYVKAEIYADGEKIYEGLVKTVNEDLSFLNEAVTGKIAMFTLRVRDYYSANNTGASIDMDYMKIYAPGETFNGKLTESENVSTEKIGMVFNSIPSYDEIASKITVVDEAGVKVSDVVYADFLGENNIGDNYDAKAELIFATELEDNKNYILKVDGLTDVSGNKMTQYYPFTTGIGDIFSDGFTIETREAEGKTYAKVSAKVLNKSLPETALTVTIASYTLSGEIETMVNIAEKDVTLTVSEDGQSFVSEEIEVTGADFVRGFLNKGTKAFIPAGEFPITAQ